MEPAVLQSRGGVFFVFVVSGHNVRTAGDEFSYSVSIRTVYGKLYAWKGTSYGTDFMLIAVFCSENRRRLGESISLSRCDTEIHKALQCFRVNGGGTADYETDFSAQLVQNFLEHLAAYIYAQFKQESCHLDSKCNFLFHASLLNSCHNLFVNRFYEQRNAEKYGDLIFHDVVLQVFETVTEGGGSPCGKHDELACRAEGMVVRKECHAHIAVAYILHLLDGIYIGSYVLLRKHNRLRHGCGA